MTPTNTTMVGPQELATAVASAVAAGRRFAGIVASAGMDGSTELMAWLAGAGDLVPIATILEGSVRCYPSLSMQVPSAQWYEREIHDLFGVVPEGHPYLAPLVLPATAPGGRRFWPRPGGGGPQPRVGDLVPPPAPPHVMAEGQFTIPYGPVRSGVFE
ncbi:MAG: NADH-quinone oxidoreductase subunit C, partial [Actinomycetota bacterium]